MFTWPGFSKAFSIGVLGDLVEHHPEDLRAVPFLPFCKFFLQVIADGFAFAVRVGREVDGFHLLGGLLQLLR